jgi:hypothetical protein
LFGNTVVIVDLNGMNVVGYLNAVGKMREFIAANSPLKAVDFEPGDAAVRR